jgi:hypothetical protein
LWPLWHNFDSSVKRKHMTGQNRRSAFTSMKTLPWKRWHFFIFLFSQVSKLKVVKVTSGRLAKKRLEIPWWNGEFLVDLIRRLSNFIRSSDEKLPILTEKVGEFFQVMSSSIGVRVVFSLSDCFPKFCFERKTVTFNWSTNWPNFLTNALKIIFDSNLGDCAGLQALRCHPAKIQVWSERTGKHLIKIKILSKK